MQAVLEVFVVAGDLDQLAVSLVENTLLRTQDLHLALDERHGATGLVRDPHLGEQGRVPDQELRVLAKETGHLRLGGQGIIQGQREIAIVHRSMCPSKACVAGPAM